MASDLTERFRLETAFLPGYVEHTIRLPGVPGTRRERWRGVREIGAGGFAIVQEEKEEGGRTRAVKLLNKRQIPAALDYRRELLAMATMTQFPQFVQLLGWFENRHYVCIAMELFELGDLAVYLERNGAMSEADAIGVSRQLMEGLELLHKHRFTHRDLKPQNVFVASTNPILSVKIGDFGISKRISTNATTALRTVVYTPSYAAPEVLKMDGQEYSNAVDLWSIGCVIHEMLTLKVPFPGALELAQYMIGGAQFPQHLEARGVSSLARQFVTRLLVVDPSKRPSAAEAAQDPWLRISRPVQSAPSISSHEASRGESNVIERGTAQIYEAPTFKPEIDTVTPQIPSKLPNTYLNIEFPMHHAASLGDDAAIRLIHAQNLLGPSFDINGQDSYGNTPLYYAIQCDSIRAARVLVTELNAATAAVTSEGHTALQVAVARRNEDMVRMLIRDCKADVNAPGKFLNTALHIAGEERYLNMIEMLIAEFGASATVKNVDGNTPSDVAFNMGGPEAGRLIWKLAKVKEEQSTTHEDLSSLRRKNGSRYVDTRLQEIEESIVLDWDPQPGLDESEPAVQSTTQRFNGVILRDPGDYQTPILESSSEEYSLINKLYPVIQRCTDTVIGKLKKPGNQEMYPLHWAIIKNDASRIKKLFQIGAYILAPNHREEFLNLTPLDIAGHLGHLEAALTLLNQSPDDNPYLRDEHGLTAIDRAFRNNHVEVAYALRARREPPFNGHIDSVTYSQRFPLHVVAANGGHNIHKHMTTVLDNPRSRDTMGNTALHIAAVTGSTSAVDYLLYLDRTFLNKSLIRETNLEGLTAAQLAEAVGNNEIAEAIQKTTPLVARLADKSINVFRRRSRKESEMSGSSN